jgi:hypothetical protein
MRCLASRLRNSLPGVGLVGGGTYACAAGVAPSIVCKPGWRGGADAAGGGGTGSPDAGEIADANVTDSDTEMGRTGGRGKGVVLMTAADAETAAPAR